MKRIWAFFLWVPILAAQVVPGQYIVELSGAPAAIHARPGRNARRAQIRAAQQPVRRLLEQRGAVVRFSLDTVANALIVDLPDEKAAALAKVPGVARIYPVVEMRMHLDHALPLHFVPAAWAAIGGQDAAGAGIKIGIINSGIDPEHPGFQDPNMTPPPGYPLGDPAFTNNKIIVARSYLAGVPATDRLGHGTGVAMAAAGVTNSGPLATITGVAPKAFLGNYKVNDNLRFSTAPVMRALDDAVADGMDVINISSGVPRTQRVEDDPLVKAVEVATQAGVVVVVSAGNNGRDAQGGVQPSTITSPATAPSALAVGASSSDRRFFPPSIAVGGILYQAQPGSGPAPDGAITAILADVSTLDNDGLACRAFDPGSLTDKIAFILRGVCAFQQKLDNVQQAGAVAAVVYNNEPTGLITMNAGQNTLPAMFLPASFGSEIKQVIQRRPTSTSATLRFTGLALRTEPALLAPFSSLGPNVNGTIKPDVMAVGYSIYTATQKGNPASDLYDPSGYSVTAGTSYSSPLVAGAAAILKAARPGLTPHQYRSLLINTAGRMYSENGSVLPVQRAGAGVLAVEPALRSTVAAAPSSLGFGAGTGAVDITRDLTISNLGTADDTFTIWVESLNGPAPSLSTNAVQIAPGGSQAVQVHLAATALDPGEYQGFLCIQGTQTDLVEHVPYWYGVSSPNPRYITVVDAPEAGTPNSLVTIYLRVTDASGIILPDADIRVTAGAGGGQVTRIQSVNDLFPGVFSVEIRLGPTEQVDIFHVEAGDVAKDIPVVASFSAP